MGVVALGFVYFFLGYKYSMMKQKLRVDTDKRNMQMLKDSRENARLLGVKRQLEILDERNRERNPQLHRDKDKGTGSPRGIDDSDAGAGT